MSNSKQLSQEDIYKDLFKRYNLVYDKDDPKNSDVFISPRYKIITRSGIDKIQAKLGMSAEFDVVYVDPFEIIIKGKFSVDSTSIETFGEASVDRLNISIISNEREEGSANGSTKKVSFDKVEQTVIKRGNVGQNPPYLAAMAEKRARSRGVLRLAGLYDLGFYGEDESDDFTQSVRDIKSSKIKVS